MRIRTFLLFIVLTGLVTYGWIQQKPVSQAAPSISEIGGAFTAHDQHGRIFSSRTLEGKPTAIFFGYTFCPDICPTTLNKISLWLNALGKDADKFNIVFVTVDSARDTPSQMAQYLSSFDARIIGLSPSESELKEMAKNYRFYYAKSGDGENYLVDHTAEIYLLDKNLHLSGTISPDENNITSLQKIRTLLKPS